MSDHDNEREAFEKWCKPRGYSIRQCSPYSIASGQYADYPTRDIWFGWQAHAAVKPVQDDLARIANNLAMLINRIAYRHSKELSLEHPIKQATDYIKKTDMQGSCLREVASTGNTEERTMANLEHVARGINAQMRQNPESLQDQWYNQGLQDAKQIALLCALPHLSDTVVGQSSAEKAWVSGLVEHPVFAFLLGEGQLDGLSFGDRSRPDSQGGTMAFWWRKHLREALEAFGNGAPNDQ